MDKQDLLKTKDTTILPKDASDPKVAESFNQFFVGMILNIRSSSGAGPTVEYVSLSDMTLLHYTHIGA